MLNDEERGWLCDLLSGHFSPGQLVQLVDGTGHRYDQFIVAGMVPSATITEIVRQASDQGWDGKLVDQLAAYVDAHFDGQVRADVLAGLAALGDAIAGCQGQMAPLPTTAPTIPSAAAVRHMRTQLDELQRRFDVLTRRITALDTDIGRELDSERRLALEARRADLALERDAVTGEMTRLEGAIAG
jgi:hypothetical protein